MTGGETNVAFVGVPPLLGRDHDVRRLDDVLVRAAGGGGRLALISGEAGIGKTRLCEEIARAHRRRDGQVLVGRAFPGEEGTPFRPLADALRNARRSDRRFWDAAAARADVLWAVAPELGSEGRPCDRAVLFEALLDAVEESANGRVTLWVVDDVQWADDSTWEFVCYAARRIAHMSLVLAVTYRDEEIGPDHPWWTALARLRRDLRVQEVRLGRLGARDTARVARAVAPGLPEATIARIAERSAGTPLLVVELANLASRSGDVPAVPDIVLATVRERAARLGAAARDLLPLAAVAGVEIDEALLAALLPDAAADELVAAGLVERAEQHVRFRHPLLQEAVYREVPLAGRRVLHEQIAGVLAAGGPDLAERAAAHLERAGRSESALALLERRAEEAGRRGCLGRAATLRLTALRLARRHEALAQHRSRLELAAIRELSLTGRWSELDPLVRDAWLRRDALAAAERAWLASAFTLHLLWFGAAGDAASLVETELAHLEAGGGLDYAAPLLAQGGLVWWFRGRAEVALGYGERALEIARRRGDVAAECHARAAIIHATYGLDRDRRAAAAAHGDNADFASAHRLGVEEVLALWARALYTARVEDLDAMDRAAERTGTAHRAYAKLLRASVGLLEGRVDEAELAFRRLGREVRLATPTAAPWVDVEEAWLHLHRGDLSAAARLLTGPTSELLDAWLAPWAADRHSALGWLAWERGRWAEAADHLAAAAKACRAAAIHKMVGGPILLPLHVDALVRLGQPERARSVVERAADTFRDPDRFFAAALAASRFRAMPVPAVAAEAEARAAAAPWPWLRALVGTWRGELLRELEAALAARRAFEAIGAEGGARRTDGVLRRLGVPPASAGGAAPTVLSRRELEVARLVAEGLSNPAIAQRLFLSRPTVASHVAHILAKLDFTSRAQIAAWVSRKAS
jgi:DNA-binding CsgD family transcriptional regulator/tetratricopeptide (TPR) repeat protein